MFIHKHLQYITHLKYNMPDRRGSLSSAVFCISHRNEWMRNTGVDFGGGNEGDGPAV